MDPFDFDSYRRLEQQFSDYLRMAGLDSVQRVLEENRRFYEALWPPQPIYQQLSPVVQTAIELARQQDELLKSARIIPDAVSEFAKQYGELYERTEFLSALGQLNALDAFVPTQTRSVLEDIERIRRELARLGFTPRPPRRAARKRKAKRAERSGTKDYVQLARELLLGLIIPLIIALHDSAAREEIEGRLTDKIDAVEAKIEEQRAGDARAAERQRQMEQLLVQALTALQRIEVSQVQMLVRERSVVMRQSPAKGSHVVARLPPETIVELLDLRGEWIQVRFADPETSEPREGWALRRYFRHVPRSDDKSGH